MSNDYIKIFDEIGNMTEFKAGESIENNKTVVKIKSLLGEINNSCGVNISRPPLIGQSTIYKTKDIKEKLLGDEVVTKENLIKNVKKHIEKIKEDINIDDKDRKTLKSKFYLEDGETISEKKIDSVVNQLLENEIVYSKNDAYWMVKGFKFQAYNPVDNFWAKQEGKGVYLSIIFGKEKWIICIEKSKQKTSEVVDNYFEFCRQRKNNENLKNYYIENKNDAGDVCTVEKDYNSDGLVFTNIKTGERFSITDDQQLLEKLIETIKALKKEYEKMRGDIIHEEYIDKLKKSKNIIFRGAPGTGKTHLAKDIAAFCIAKKKYEELSESEREQLEFVQFHPSYDYTDFVEGLRPVKTEDLNDTDIKFELRPGIFKTFCDKAKVALESGDKESAYIFIIDEINRGEISKIFGELFYSIDPGYRGEAGGVLTQYSNLHEDKIQKFYVPQNVYIIGTMNDIDRSVEPFDFAMRRRFRFVEIKPEDTQDAILDSLNDEREKQIAIKKMQSLNAEIIKNPDLGANYQLGAAYFAKLKELDFSYDELWEDYLNPLLHDYLQGTGDVESVDKELGKLKSIVVDKKGTGSSEEREVDDTLTDSME